MPDDAVKPAIRAALRANEIGDRTPYEISFAAKGDSGASFGVMQGDLAKGRPEVRKAFLDAMAAGGMEPAQARALCDRLSVHLLRNPLSTGETAAVNAALAAGSAIVDAMDEMLVADAYAGVDACLGRAAANGRTITAAAQAMIAMWTNMTGKPTKLLAWLDGDDPQLGAPVPPPGDVVDAAALEGYLAQTKYFRENPRNLKHFMDSVPPAPMA